MASKPIFTLLLLLQLLILSSARRQDVIKGGYWPAEIPGNLDSLINSTIFTHLFFAFAHLNATTNQVLMPDYELSQAFPRAVAEIDPAVKTILSIGGSGANTTAYARMVADSRSRSSFINSAINLTRAEGFDGMDLDWEYPKTADQMVQLGRLLDEWRLAIKREGKATLRKPLLLTAAVHYSPKLYKGVVYPIRSIARSVDWINLKAYDFYTPLTTNLTHAPAQLHSGRPSGSSGIAAWIRAGVPRQKLVLGMPFYGYLWWLVSPDNHGLLAPATGDVSGEKGGVVGYNEISEYGGTKVYNETVVTNYLYVDREDTRSFWVGYDDTESVVAKVRFAKRNGLRGYFAWHVSFDFREILSNAASGAWNITASSSSSLIAEA